MDQDEQKVTQCCGTAFQSGPAHWYSITAAEEAVNLHFTSAFHFPPPLGSSDHAYRGGWRSASKCIWPQFSSAQDECVCVCAQTTNWFKLRANIYREWVAVQLWCAAQNFLWFACRSQSSVLPFLCSLIINKPLTEYITGWAVTQQALDCYLKLVMNDSRPITGKCDTHINERRQRVSQSEMSKSMTQTSWDYV